MSALDIYRQLEKRSCGAMEALFEDAEMSTLFTRAHNHLTDYQAIKLALSHRYESHMVDLTIKEYEFSLLALVSGSYRHAFSGLRLSFELSIAAIYFSAIEIDYRMWLNKSKDIKWGVLTNVDSGVFSAAFATAFNANLADERLHYQSLSAAVYRECSEYVHGNAHTHSSLPESVAYERGVVENWCEMADTINLVTIFSVALRYARHLNSEQLAHIEPLMRERLGHIPSIQSAFI